MSASILIYSAKNGSNICFSQFSFYVLQCKVNKKKSEKKIILQIRNRDETLQKNGSLREGMRCVQNFNYFPINRIKDNMKFHTAFNIHKIPTMF